MLNTLHEERIWPEKYVPRLRLLGEIIINALERRNNDTALRQNEIELQEQLREIKQLKLKIEMENFYLRDEVALLYEHSGIIAVSRIMKSVLQQLEQVARTKKVTRMVRRHRPVSMALMAYRHRRMA